MNADSTDTSNERGLLMHHSREHKDHSSLTVRKRKDTSERDSHPCCATTWYPGRPRLMVMSEREQICRERDAKRSCRTNIYLYLKDTLRQAATGKKSVERRKISAIFRSRNLNCRVCEGLAECYRNWLKFLYGQCGGRGNKCIYRFKKSIAMDE